MLGTMRDFLLVAATLITDGLILSHKGYIPSFSSPPPAYILLDDVGAALPIDRVHRAFEEAQFEWPARAERVVLFVLSPRTCPTSLVEATEYTSLVSEDTAFVGLVLSDSIGKASRYAKLAELPFPTIPSDDSEVRSVLGFAEPDARRQLVIISDQSGTIERAKPLAAIVTSAAYKLAFLRD